MASYHMKSEALVWYQHAIDKDQFNTCDLFVKAFLIRFGPTAYDDLMDFFTWSKQVTIVISYKAWFESLSNRFKVH